MLRQALINRIEAYCALHRLTDWQFSKRIGSHGHLVRRIRAGQARLRTLELVDRFLTEAPPPPPPPPPPDLDAARKVLAA